MQDYEKLQQVIQQYNPEILELKSGCVIRTDKWSFNTKEWICGTLNGEETTWHCSLRGNTEIRRNEIKEILGRPIQFHDVMWAVKLKYKIYFPHAKQWQWTIGAWNLLEDLDGQNPITKQFLIKLLT